MKNCVGIDPGASTGLAVLTLDDKLSTTRLSLDKLKTIDEKCGYLACIVEHYVTSWCPGIVVIELPPYIPSHGPHAYSVLNQYIGAILVGCYIASNYVDTKPLPIVLANNREAKRRVIGKGTASKETIKEVILNSKYAALENRATQIRTFDEFDACMYAMYGRILLEEEGYEKRVS